MVDDLPRCPSRGGGTCKDGVDMPDRCDMDESFRKMAGPGAPSGAFVNANVECVGEGKGDA